MGTNVVYIIYMYQPIWYPTSAYSYHVLKFGDIFSPKSKSLYEGSYQRKRVYKAHVLMQITCHIFKNVFRCNFNIFHDMECTLSMTRTEFPNVKLRWIQGVFLSSLLYCFRPSKKNNWLASFFQKFYGREGGFYFYFFDSEVLIGRNTSKTHPYLLLFLHPSVQAFYIIHKHHNGTQKT